jgi:hypothetical protein
VRGRRAFIFLFFVPFFPVEFLTGHDMFHPADTPFELLKSPL